MPYLKDTHNQQLKVQEQVCEVGIQKITCPKWPLRFAKAVQLLAVSLLFCECSTEMQEILKNKGWLSSRIAGKEGMHVGTFKMCACRAQGTCSFHFSIS